MYRITLKNVKSTEKILLNLSASFVVQLHNGFAGDQHISVSHAMQDKLKVIM